MATPLTQSIFQPLDFDLFLEEIGLLGDLGAEARVALSDQITEAIEYAMITKIFHRLTPYQQGELVQLMQEADKTGNEAPVNDYLLGIIPDADILAKEAVEEVKDSFRISTNTVDREIARFVALHERLEKSEATDFREDLGFAPTDRINIAEQQEQDEADLLANARQSITTTQPTASVPDSATDTSTSEQAIDEELKALKQSAADSDL
jgi:hypothetical protein